MKKIIWIILALVIILLGVFFFNKPVNKYSESDYQAYQNSTSTLTEVSASTTSRVIKASDVATHNSQADCWATISGKVYDLTGMVSQHPGGAEAILSICGKDGTATFSGQHGENQKVLSLLPRFYIGDLNN